MNNAVIQNGMPRAVRSTDLGIRDQQTRTNFLLPDKNPTIYAQNVNIYNFNKPPDMGGLIPPTLPGWNSQNSGGVMGSNYQTASDLMNQIPNANSMSNFFPEFANNLQSVLDDPSAFHPLHSVGQATSTLIDKLTNLTSQNKQLGYTGYGLGRKVYEDISTEYKSSWPALVEINSRIARMRQEVSNVKEHDDIESLRRDIDALRKNIPNGALTTETQLSQQQNIKKTSSKSTPLPNSNPLPFNTPYPVSNFELGDKYLGGSNKATFEMNGKRYETIIDPKRTETETKALNVLKVAANAAIGSLPGGALIKTGLELVKATLPGDKYWEIAKPPTAKDIVGYKNNVPIYSKEYQDYAKELKLKEQVRSVGAPRAGLFGPSRSLF